MLSDGATTCVPCWSRGARGHVGASKGLYPKLASLHHSSLHPLAPRTMPHRGSGRVHSSTQHVRTTCPTPPCAVLCCAVLLVCGAQELPALLAAHFPQLDTSNASITGHSMGGHGALTIALKNPGMFKSLSVFAPIVNPCEVPWGIKAFSGYFGGCQAGQVPAPTVYFCCNAARMFAVWVVCLAGCRANLSRCCRCCCVSALLLFLQVKTTRSCGRLMTRVSWSGATRVRPCPPS